MKKYLPFLILCILPSMACSSELVLDVVIVESMTVKIEGPRGLVTLSKGFMQGIPYGGCVYSIAWGDGVQSPEIGEAAPYCSSDLTHTYQSPGEYKIEVSTYGFGPDDGPVNERRGEIIVEVR